MTPRRVIRLLSLLVTGAGLFIALLPMISVWRLSGHVLRELPAVAASSTTTDRDRFALRSEEFDLATRSYEGLSADNLGYALREDGFDALNVRGELWYSKPCCGTYDAVWVRIDEIEPSRTEATLTVADGDIQQSWPIITLFGVVVSLIGLGLAKASWGLRVGRRRPIAL